MTRYEDTARALLSTPDSVRSIADALAAARHREDVLEIIERTSSKLDRAPRSMMGPAANAWCIGRDAAIKSFRREARR